MTANTRDKFSSVKTVQAKCNLRWFKMREKNLLWIIMKKVLDKHFFESKALKSYSFKEVVQLQIISNACKSELVH